MHARPSGLITLTTDFGLHDPYVGILKGALLATSAKPRIIDMSHSIAPQDVAMGAFYLWTAIDRFLPGTVHVGMVDPGVGSGRRLLAISAHECYWLVPDNALAGAVLAAAPTCEVRVLDLEHLRIRTESRAFNGCDILAPVAAWLGSGRYGFSAMGPICTDCDTRDLVFAGDDRVVHVDGYGNLITNVRAQRVQPGMTVVCGERSVVLHDQLLPGQLLPDQLLPDSAADVREGQPFAYVGSYGLLELAVAHGSAREQLALQRGAPIALRNP